MVFMPAHFDSLGISFQYPDNWTLDDSDALLGRKSVTVYSPGGAFWSVAIHSEAAEPAEPAKLAAAIVDALANPGHRAAWAAAARESVTAFTSAATARCSVEEYARILARPGGGTGMRPGGR